MTKSTTTFADKEIGTDKENIEMAREQIALHDLEISLSTIKNAINVCTDSEAKTAMLPIAETLAAKVAKVQAEYNAKWGNE